MGFQFFSEPAYEFFAGGSVRVQAAEPRGFAIARERLTSFDRQFTADVRVQRPDRYRLLDSLPEDEPRIARGGGVSYVAASFGADTTSLDMRAFDRLHARRQRSPRRCSRRPPRDCSRATSSKG